MATATRSGCLTCIEFKHEEKGTDKVRMNDSYLRLADCRFVNSKYGQAMEAYAKVIEQKSVDADYAFYQRAISYGFMGKNEKSLITINDVEYNIEDFTDEQKTMLNHVNDLGRKLDNARFNVDQLSVGREKFIEMLASSLETPEIG